MMFAIGIILTVVVGGVRPSQDYCQLGQDNTMCQYKPGSGCSKLRWDFDETVMKEILHVHNQFRQKIALGEQPNQPPAANMMEMTYDYEFAAMAQRWEDQCKFGHDQNRLTFRFRDRVGQNPAATGSDSNESTPQFGTEAIAMWFNEVVHFSPSFISPYEYTGDSGHYSQLVWADSYAVGCGYTFYEESGWYNKHYVCNYGPGGNIYGGVMYEVGEPCSKCQVGCSANYPGLCANDM